MRSRSEMEAELTNKLHEIKIKWRMAGDLVSSSFSLNGKKQAFRDVSVRGIGHTTADMK